MYNTLLTTLISLSLNHHLYDSDTHFSSPSIHLISTPTSLIYETITNKSLPG